jgi:leucyl aminopeptidase
MKIAFAKPELPKSGTLAVSVMQGRKLGPTAETLDRKTKGAIARAMAASRFRGGGDEILAILAPAGLEFDRLVLYGTGKADGLDALSLQAIGGRLTAHLNSSGADVASIAVDALDGNADAQEADADDRWCCRGADRVRTRRGDRRWCLLRPRSGV